MLNRREMVTGLSGVLITTLSGCAAFAPESNLRDVPLELRNERSIPMQATVTFDDFPPMVVTEEDKKQTWRITAPAQTAVFEDHQAQPDTYDPHIEVRRLSDDSILHADTHEVNVPEPRGSLTTVTIIVSPGEVRVDIQANTAV